MVLPGQLQQPQRAHYADGWKGKREISWISLTTDFLEWLLCWPLGQLFAWQRCPVPAAEHPAIPAGWRPWAAVCWHTWCEALGDHERCFYLLGKALGIALELQKVMRISGLL